MTTSALPPSAPATRDPARRTTLRADPRRGRITFLAVTALLAGVAFTGGASRADALSQPLVRTLAITLAGGLLAFGRTAEWRSLRWPLVLMGALVAITALYLVPLPPAAWTALPGRDLIAATADAIGQPQPWRPLAMTPWRGMNALLSLAAPAAMLIGLVQLSPRRRAALLLPVIMMVLVSAVLGLAQVSAGPGSALRWYAVTNRDAAVGLFANRNHEALLLAMGLPLLAAWGSSRASGGPTPARTCGSR